MTSSKLRRNAIRLSVAVPALLVLLLLLAWGLLRASLPQLDGAINLPGLTAPLDISRDASGTVSVQGENRQDLARGLGFVHAQERFFEMDLTRRSAAGELSALFGAVALERDKTRRTHRMRTRLTERLAQLPEADKALLQAYTRGVNAGLAALPLRPWQYLLLRAEPLAWDPVDSLLVVGEMFFMLQADSFDRGFERAWLRERAGDSLFDWLNPRGGRRDAALDGSRLPDPDMPGPAQLDLRQRAMPQFASSGQEDEVIGSNNWAVAGSRSAHGGAILANDMHLNLGAPGIWFRTQLQLGSGPKALGAAGLSLPGTPSLVVGSNGSVAWGFTNAYGQWFDWIELPAQLPPGRLSKFNEVIAVKGAAAQALVVEEFDGSPIVQRREGRRYALRWVAHQGAAFNMELDRMLQAATVEDALRVAQSSGLPHQNILIADRAGHIGWTIAGQLWSQAGMGKSYARFQSIDLPGHSWLSPADYPVQREPAAGQLWTANNRQLGGAAAEAIGDGGFDLGARALQIRDRLSATAIHDEASLAAIHLDDEARFMQSWAARLGPLLDASPGHGGAAALLKQWNGRADADQAGYRLVRMVRLKTLDLLWAAWTSKALGEPQADDKQRPKWRAQFEYSAARAIDQQPAHLLPKDFANWDALLLAQVDTVLLDLRKNEQTLDQSSWGRFNASRIQHPLARAIPALGWLLDMPSLPQSGDSNLPHVAGPAFGQSERLVVSPGREEQSTLVMPGGQSGHPLSPYYGAGHADWARGLSKPLLAGAMQHRLSASPARD